MDDGTVNIFHGNIAHTTQSNGFFTTGGGGGFSGSGSAGRRRRAKRLQTLEQHRRETAIAAQNQTIATQTLQYESARNALDAEHSLRRTTLDQVVQTELNAIHPSVRIDREVPGSFALLKDKASVDHLLALKKAELQAMTTRANAFFGSAALNQTTQDYLNRFHELGSTASAHQSWASSYDAAQAVRTLTEIIRRLTEQSHALSVKNTQFVAEWRAREERWEREAQKHRALLKAQEADVKAFRKNNEERRLEVIRSTNTVSAPAGVAASRPMLITASALLSPKFLETALDVALGDAMAELLRIARLRTGQIAGTFVTAMTYSPVLGDAELSGTQRDLAIKALSVPAEMMELPDNLDLRKTADENGTVDLDYRVRFETQAMETKFLVARTDGNIVPSAVKVVAGILDPLTNSIQVTGEGFSPITLRLTTSPQETTASAPSMGYSGLIMASGQPPVETIPTGADTRFNDRLIVFPQHLGLAPFYVAFNTPWGNPEVATGNGQPTTNDLRGLTRQGNPAAIPSQLADRLRGRQFISADDFKKDFWKTTAKDKDLSRSLYDLNAKRMEKGYAPIAKKSDWVGDSRKFDLRYLEQPTAARDTYNFDEMGIVGPNGRPGTTDVTSTAAPWSLPGSPVSDAFDAARKAFSANAGSMVSNPPNWTPLIPPGSELLGPTPLPGVPVRVPVYLGGTTTPLPPQNETLPGIDVADVLTGILWLPTDPGLAPQYVLYAEMPVRPLEVGPYGDLSKRSVKDGLDADHIPSRKALESHLAANFPELPRRKIKRYLDHAPSITIPTSIHQKYSETYAGRNTKDKQAKDSADIQAAVDSNFNAIKQGLLEEGFLESDIEKARQQLHVLNKEQGWY
ncbi:hypothetical protein ABH909_000974 [Pseudomonas sp. BS3782 TE3695]|uniref:S-type pyocin domain-containing protein n=1 Tax=Pseudomonas sp. BS3782 TE3695 TaxID=3349323 RepID=UPI003D2469A0